MIAIAYSKSNWVSSIDPDKTPGLPVLTDPLTYVNLASSVRYPGCRLIEFDQYYTR